MSDSLLFDSVKGKMVTNLKLTLELHLGLKK